MMERIRSPWNCRQSILMIIFLLGFILMEGLSHQVNSVCNAYTSQTPPPLLLRLAHGAKLDHPTNLIAQEVATKIFALTRGRIQIEIYENMLYGQEIDLINLLRKEQLDFAIVSTGPLSFFDPNINIIDLPYLFSSAAQSNQALDGEPGRIIFKSLSNQGIEGICFWENGPRSITTKNTIIKKPGDLKNLKIRVMQSPIYISFFRKLGAIPTPMAWGEVIPAIQSGIINAQENPIPIIFINNLDQYQHNLILTEHTYNPHLVLTSPSLRKKLKENDLNLIYREFNAAKYKQRRMVKEQSLKYLKILQEKGMKIITPDLESFRRMGQNFSKAEIAKYNPEIRKYFERYFQ